MAMTHVVELKIRRNRMAAKPILFSFPFQILGCKWMLDF